MWNIFKRSKDAKIPLVDIVEHLQQYPVASVLLDNGQFDIYDPARRVTCINYMILSCGALKVDLIYHDNPHIQKTKIYANGYWRSFE